MNNSDMLDGVKNDATHRAIGLSADIHGDLKSFLTSTDQTLDSKRLEDMALELLKLVGTIHKASMLGLEFHKAVWNIKSELK